MISSFMQTRKQLLKWLANAHIPFPASDACLTTKIPCSSEHLQRHCVCTRPASRVSAEVHRVPDGWSSAPRGVATRRSWWRGTKGSPYDREIGRGRGTASTLPMDRSRLRTPVPVVPPSANSGVMVDTVGVNVWVGRGSGRRGRDSEEALREKGLRCLDPTGKTDPINLRGP